MKAQILQIIVTNSCFKTDTECFTKLTPFLNNLIIWIFEIIIQCGQEQT